MGIGKPVLFNSYEFIFAFLPITFIGFILFSKLGAEKAIGWLVCASLFFYGWWNPIYLVLIILSMVFNYTVGKILSSLHQKTSITAKYYLILGISVNLGLLGYFKYANFFLENYALLTSSEFEFQNIVLPLAISFFTFQQIAFLVDSYKGITKEYRALHYALFVTFFPQLIAGPIVHHKEMLPQFMKDKTFRVNLDNIVIGIAIFSIGLFKKAVIADGVALNATPIFEMAATGQPTDFFQSWGGALSYTLQLYFDFSGYSDMAIGAARLFGIKLPLNFHSPYKSLNITEFWRRWHMTLSRFLRDYVYIALGGNRKGNVRRYNNLLITMLLGGLWHGAGWTFVIWGALHGLYLVINHFWHFVVKKLRLAFLNDLVIWRIISWTITFVAVVIGWVFFRAESMDTAMVILKGMAGLNGISIPNAIYIRLGGLSSVLNDFGITASLGGGRVFVNTYLWIILLFPFVVFWPNTQQIMENFKPSFDNMKDNLLTSLSPNNLAMRKFRFKYSLNWALLTTFISTVGILALSQISEFLYFQF